MKIVDMFNMRCPSIFKIERLIIIAQENSVGTEFGYFPARPITAFGIKARLRATWLVFTGKADAVTWSAGQ